MKYEKPNVVQLESAVVAIQATAKLQSDVDTANEPSMPAYEADE